MTATPFNASVRWLVVVLFCLSLRLSGEVLESTHERNFPQTTKTALEKTIKPLAVSGRLPVLEGFVIPDVRPLARFQRGYYQCSLQIVPLPSGGSRVRVNTKITAWYTDPTAAHSGYRTLASNGRIETDLLDQIADALLLGAPLSESIQSSGAVQKFPESSISAPMPRIPDNQSRSSLHAAPDENVAGSLRSQTDAQEKRESELIAEAKGLEEILQNQSHPNNLVAIKKNRTPVLQSPNAEAKVLFTASAEDEFEMLDMNPNWVHVRISALSRGWIRRSALQMPANIAGESTSASSQNTAREFRISNEQVALFPGDWQPLHGKMVKIVTVRRTKETLPSPPTEAKLKFAKAIFIDEYSKLDSSTESPEGIVLIFDSEDGGMIAATSSTIKEWKPGPTADETTWKECFFDPPELSGTRQK